MRTKFLEAYNASNLIRNGGFEYRSTSGPPPYWEVQGASYASSPNGNYYNVTWDRVPETADAAVNCFDVSLRSSVGVSLLHNFSKRFIQMGFVTTLEEGNIDYDQDYDTRMPPGYDNIRVTQLVRDVELTFSFSAYVLSGKVDIYVRFSVDGDVNVNSPMLSGFTAGTWLRPSKVFKFGKGLVEEIEILISRSADVDVAEVLLGNFALAPGAFRDLPYTGDPSADAIPRGAVVFAFGLFCPPGYEKIELEAAPASGRIFLKNGTSEGPSVEGEESHDHSDATMQMKPTYNWDTLTVIQHPEGAQAPAAVDLASNPHTHALASANHVPPSTDVILCRRT